MPSKKGKKKTNKNNKKKAKQQEKYQQQQQKQETKNNSKENEIENQKSLLEHEQDKGLEKEKKQEQEQQEEEPKDELLKNPLSQDEINTNDEELPELVPDSELEPIPELSFNEEFNFEGDGFQMSSDEEEQDWEFAKHAKEKNANKEKLGINMNEKSEDEINDENEEEDNDNDDDEIEDDDENEEEEEEYDEDVNDDDDENDNEEEEEEEEEKDDGDVTRSIDISGKEKLEEKQSKNETDAEQGYDREFFDTAPNLDYNITFDELNLSRPLRAAIDKLGYIHPTPIQAQSIPILLEGRDMCASAMTGSGKTAAFLLPTMERLLYRSRNVPASRVLIILPTRELAVQCFSMAEKLGQLTDIRSALICGGLPRQSQEQALLTKPDIIIGTPGRIIDHLLNSKSFTLIDIQVLILDEADRLLDMGFYDQLIEIVKSCPRDRQTVLFSATMTDKVDTLAGLSLKHPIRISIDNRENVAKGLTQDIIKIRQRNRLDREATLMALCTRTFKQKVLVFCNYRRTVDRLDVLFRMNGLLASSLHGLMSQDLRLVALEKFKKNESDFLIATDVASRGLDIKGVQTVINFEMPEDLSSYIHRVGRTARAGQEGVAVSICDESSRPLLKKIIRNAHKKESPIRYRDVPKNVMQHWSKKLEKEEKLIQEEVEMKKVERKMEENEMYRRKADNIAKYREQILSRPERSWFKDPKREEQEKREMSKKHRMKEAKKRAKDLIKASKKKETEEQRIARLKKEFMKKWKAENQQRKSQQREARKQRELKEFKEATGYDDVRDFFKEAKAKQREDPDRFKRVQQKRREKKKRQKAKAKRVKKQKDEDEEEFSGMSKRKRKAMKQGGRSAKRQRRK